MQTAGIDYSLGQANIDLNTGIHYGVINQNEVLQAWADSSEPFYGEQECSVCGDSLTIDMATCPSCHTNLVSEFDCIEPVSWFINDGEYMAECGDDGDIFITRSPYYTLCSFCSPCAPGAGYLMDSREDGVKAYCFGHEFFDDGVAPYTVYSVETGEEVKNEIYRN